MPLICILDAFKSKTDRFDAHVRVTWNACVDRMLRWPWVPHVIPIVFSPYIPTLSLSPPPPGRIAPPLLQPSLIAARLLVASHRRPSWSAAGAPWPVRERSRPSSARSSRRPSRHRSYKHARPSLPPSLPAWPRRHLPRLAGAGGLAMPVGGARPPPPRPPWRPDARPTCTASTSPVTPP